MLYIHDAVNNVTLKYVSEYDIHEKDLLIDKNLRPFKGMMQVHQIVWASSQKYVLALRRQSCLEIPCKLSSCYCEHNKHVGFY